MPYLALDIPESTTYRRDKKTTPGGESILTSSISCNKLNSEGAGTNTKMIVFFWHCGMGPSAKWILMHLERKR
jgi:hypothetical protein